MPRQLSHLVKQVARQSVGKDWELYAALLDHWQEIVGDDYARVTTPVKVLFPHQPNEARRRNGTLTVRLPKGLAMEFTYKAEQIRQRINAYFGYDAIAKIAFDPVFGIGGRKKAKTAPDPVEAAKIAEQAESMDSADLKAALQSFGQALVNSDRDPV